MAFSSCTAPSCRSVAGGLLTLMLNHAPIDAKYNLQVKHMLSVETDAAFAARKQAEAAARAPRPPITVRH